MRFRLASGENVDCVKGRAILHANMPLVSVINRNEMLVLDRSFVIV